MDLNTLTYGIRGAAFTVHRCLGPGLLESAYEKCMLHELRKQGYRAESQLLLPITYDEIKVDGGYRIDILVEDLIILELKAVEALDPIHTAQLLTYLRLADKPLGLLMNFNVRNMQHGIKRYIQ
ncbi:GxxExxY protein [Neolewinella maritima]|nr:GxxExxY protein [Neolewinella maritima]